MELTPCAVPKGAAPPGLLREGVAGPEGAAGKGDGPDSEAVEKGELEEVLPPRLKGEAASGFSALLMP